MVWARLCLKVKTLGFTVILSIKWCAFLCYKLFNSILLWKLTYVTGSLWCVSCCLFNAIGLLTLCRNVLLKALLLLWYCWFKLLIRWFLSELIAAHWSMNYLRFIHGGVLLNYVLFKRLLPLPCATYILLKSRMCLFNLFFENASHYFDWLFLKKVGQSSVGLYLWELYLLWLLPLITWIAL